MKSMSRNRLTAKPTGAALENREMMMASATPTFEGFLPENTPDPDFDEIVADIPRGEVNSGRNLVQTSRNDLQTQVLRNEVDDRGSKIAVRNGDFETDLTTAERRKVLKDTQIGFHNPLTRGISIEGAGSRWYQRDGRTQVFRLFPGDQNWSGVRPGAARSEAFIDDNSLTTTASDGMMTRFQGRFNVAQHNGSRRVMLYQTKATGLTQLPGATKRTSPDWAFAVFAEPDGTIVAIDRNNAGSPIDTGKVVGESFDLTVEDNGKQFRALIDGVEIASNEWERGSLSTSSRWGAYAQREAGNPDPGSGILEEGDPQIVYVSNARVERVNDRLG